MTVIADDNGVLGFGGIMGGEDTGCTEETTNVFIECAYFDPLRTAKTGRKTAIHSDARYRFERGVDPAFILPGLEMATALVLEFCGGCPSEIELAGEIPDASKTVAFPPAEVKRLTGLAVPEGDIERILKALGFGVSRADPWLVDAPSWRPDIAGKADLVEEVARITGFGRAGDGDAAADARRRKAETDGCAIAARRRPARACRPRSTRGSDMVVHR